MLFIPLSCDIWLTPYAVANSDHYFSISHILALLSAILNKFISQHWNKSILKVEIPSFIFIFYRPFYLYYLRSYRHLKFDDFFPNFKCTAFFWTECIYILKIELSRKIQFTKLNTEASRTAIMFRRALHLLLHRAPNIKLKWDGFSRSALLLTRIGWSF